MSLSPIANSALSSTGLVTLSAAAPQNAPKPDAAVQAAPPVVQQNTEATKARALAAPAKAVKNDQLDKAVDSINRFLKPIASSIRFSVDEDSGRTLVKVIDTDTNDVLRQFPSNETLQISKDLDKLQGLLIKEKA